MPSDKKAFNLPRLFCKSSTESGYRIQSTLYIVVQRLNIKYPKRLHLEPVVLTSDYYFSKIVEVPQFNFLGRSTAYLSYNIYDLPFLEDLHLATDLSKSVNSSSTESGYRIQSMLYIVVQRLNIK